MSYSYENMKQEIFTESGFEMLQKIRDNSKRLISESGSATLGKIINSVSGDSWVMIACVDYLLEKGEIKEVDKKYTSAQARIFI